MAKKKNRTGGSEAIRGSANDQTGQSDGNDGIHASCCGAEKKEAISSSA
jgi:hypothetical protein